jgi:hypothetical protein
MTQGPAQAKISFGADKYFDPTRSRRVVCVRDEEIERFKTGTSGSVSRGRVQPYGRSYGA